MGGAGLVWTFLCLLGPRVVCPFRGFSGAENADKAYPPRAPACRLCTFIPCVAPSHGPLHVCLASDPCHLRHATHAHALPRTLPMPSPSADGLDAPAAPRHDDAFHQSLGATLASAGRPAAAGAAEGPAEIEEGYWQALELRGHALEFTEVRPRGAEWAVGRQSWRLGGALTV